LATFGGHRQVSLEASHHWLALRIRERGHAEGDDRGKQEETNVNRTVAH
jgi:hypothetical protein